MTPRRILIIRPDRLGDVVLTTPLIREVKRSFPDSFVGVMVNPVSGALLKNNPNIDVIITDDPNGKDSGKKGFLALTSKVRSLKFDTGLMPLPRERHAWMMLLAGIGTRIGVGGKIYQVLTGTRTVSRNKYIPLRHEADYVMDLGRKIGVTNEDLTPELFVSDEERIHARAILESRSFDLSHPIICINPSSNKSAPNWTPERYAELCRVLEKDHQLFINIGLPNEHLEKIFKPFTEKHFVYSGTDLREFIALCSFFSVVFSSSTGTMHIAVALKVPTVTLFCPLTACSPKLWGALGNKSSEVLPSEGFCQTQCPGDPKICTLEDIQVNQIVPQINNILRNNNRHR
ncbi:MAG: glycosyltransferase family 9 protein [Bacteroidota bacterium]